MKLDSDGMSINSLSDYLLEQSEYLKKVFGEDFYIKPEGVIDNIATSFVLAKFLLLQQLAFYVKQADPNSAEGKYQDALYERIGLYRKSSIPTIFKLKVLGNPHIVIPAYSITLRHDITNEEFVNTEQYVLSESGSAEVLFSAVVDGKTVVCENDKFTIVQNLSEEPLSLDESGAYDINIGEEDESDIQFRKRFYDIKNLRSRCSRNSVLQNLTEYVINPKSIRLIDGNSDNTIPSGYVLIIAKPSVTDENFAKIISDNVLCGIKFLGNTVKNIVLSNGDIREIKFQKASEIQTELKITVIIKFGYFANDVFALIKDGILEYVKSKSFGLGTTVYATEFIVPVLAVEGVEAVVSVLIKKASDNNYVDKIELLRDELPVFSVNLITVIQG